VDNTQTTRTVADMHARQPSRPTRVTHRGPKFLIVAVVSLIGAASLVSAASAHGSTTSNLDAQILEVAPETAQFRYSGDIDRSTAKASLRYLGSGKLAAEDYFNFDVPTLDLEQVEPLTGIGPEFGFRLPKLGKGSYAIDWEVTPVADHADSSVTLFEVTTGVADPDPTPPTPTGEDTEQSVVAPIIAPTSEAGDNWLAVVLGALVLMALGTAHCVYGRRKN